MHLQTKGIMAIENYLTIKSRNLSILMALVNRVSCFSMIARYTISMLILHDDNL